MSGYENSNPTRDNKPSLTWAKWFLDHGFVVIPLRPLDKRPAIEWKDFGERKPTPEETQKFLDMVAEGHNYAVLGGHGNLVILDFEDYELAKRWVGYSELDELCKNTLCVETVHGGLHVYLVADQIPEHKFNPAFVQGTKTVMDLQSAKSYVVGPESCVDHSNCESSKCTLKGKNVITCYEPLTTPENAKIAEFDLKGLLRELINRGKAVGVKPSPNLLKWLGGEQSTGEEKEEEKAVEEDFEKLKEELKKYDRFKGKTVEAIKGELCKTAKKRLEASKGTKAEEALNTVVGVLCEGKSYADIGIDRSRGDWRLLTFMFANGATDLDVVMQLLPPDSKFFAPKWDRYDVHTVRKAWERVRPWLSAFKTKNLTKKEVKERSTVIITQMLMKRFNVKTFYQIKPTRENVVGIFVWNPEKGIYEPFENRLRKEARKLIEFFVPLVIPLKEDDFALFKVSKVVIDNVVDEIKDKTLTELPKEPLRVAFPNVTLEWVIGKYGRYVPKLIPAEERGPEHLAFHYVPHRLLVDELIAVDAKVKEVSDITIEIIEELARRVCPKSLEVFKEWAGEKWVLLYEIIGYTLFPSQLFKKAFMLLGPTNTGKTTFANRLMRRLLGDENVKSVSIRELFDPHNRFVVANLYHKLVNTVSETGEYALNDMDRFKALTGGDSVTADVKFKDPISFVPYAKLIVATNRPPKISDRTDSAFWRRWIIVEFLNQFDVDDTWFESTFTEEELEGILTTAVLAFSRVLLHGRFDYDQTEEELKAIWLSAIDSVYNFVNEYTRAGKLVLDPSNGDLFVRTKTLYKVYIDYCKDNGYNGVGLKAFVRRLREYFGVTVQKKNLVINGERKRVRVFTGVAIADNSVLPVNTGHYKDVNELTEFLDYLRKNNGAVKEFTEVVQDFNGDREKANRLVRFCVSKNMCKHVGVDRFVFTV